MVYNEEINGPEQKLNESQTVLTNCEGFFSSYFNDDCHRSVFRRVGFVKLATSRSPSPLNSDGF